MKFINKFFKNRRAIALPIRFLVILVLCLVVLISSLTLSKTFFKENEKLIDLNENQIKEKISEISCQDSEFTCLSEDYAKLEISDSKAFTIKTTNYISPTNFSVDIYFDTAFDLTGNEFTPTDDINEWISKNDRISFIEKGKSSVWMFLISPKKSNNFTPGNYIFNINITFQDNQIWRTYELKKLIIEVY